MQEEVTLRPAALSDAAALARLHAQAFPGNHWDEHIWQRYVNAERSVVLVAEDGGSPVGAIVGQHLFEEAELLTVMVDEARRRDGVGSALVARMLEALAAEGVERVLLEVRESNRAARRLYAGSGFVESGTRRGYYPATDAREDAVLMRRDLR